MPYPHFSNNTSWTPTDGCLRCSSHDHRTAAAESDLNSMLVELDAMHFRGELRAAGWACRIAALEPGHYGSAMRDQRRIVIAERLLGNATQLRKILCHEMIHAWLYIIGDASHQLRNEAHGAAFSAELMRLSIAGEDVSGQEAFVTCGDVSRERVQAATAAFLARQRRTERPDGKFDGGGRWFPSATERQSCCANVRAPSRRFPYALLTHCRSLSHVSRLYQVDTVALRAEVAQAKRSAT